MRRCSPHGRLHKDNAMRILHWLAMMALLLSTPALAQDVLRVASPGDTLAVRFWLNGEGRPGYAVDRLGKPVIGESRMGFILSDAPKLERNFAIVGQSRRSVDESWDQPWGEWKSIGNHYNELTVKLRETGTLAREMTVVFRVYDDGVGFRYEFPEQANLKQVNVQEELTQFNVARAATAWWFPAMEWNREEYLYNRTPIASVGLAQTPMTIRTDDGVHVAFHEAALVDYSAMNIQKVEGGLLKAVLTPAASGPKVSRAAPFPTPWRTMQISDSAAGLYHSHLILNLNEPNKLGDVSWVKPRKYMGIWWGMHLDTQSWASGPKHGATTAYAKTMIDYAAKHGFSGLLVEGWNVGWDGDWFANGETFSFTEAYPDFDIKAVTDYGRKKGVVLIGHHETSANAAHYEDQMEAGFALYQRLGMDAVKTGYVSDAGGMKVRLPDGRISFEWHEGQASSRHHLKVVETAAKYRIAVNPHEPIKDTGLRRTYPNWISREGARGMEYNAWGVPKNLPDHEVNLVFTRMLSGPMDYTPGVLSLKGRHDSDIPSTLARQLALYVVLYSPIQMAADLPENYDKHLDAFQFIKDVAVDWEDTRMLAGEVGDFAVIARKDRASANWFVGAITNQQARDTFVDLSFLPAGRRYRAEIYRDGPKADYAGDRFDFVRENRTVTAADRLAIRLAAGGGYAIRLVPLR
jgi:alpha-glucosidase